MDQTLKIFYKKPGDIVTQQNSLGFSPDPKQTAVIVREVIHLINDCMIKGMIYQIEVNGQTVARSADHAQLTTKPIQLVG